MTGLRIASLIRDHDGQILLIPADFELPGTEAMIYKDGDRLVIEARPAGTASQASSPPTRPGEDEA